MDIQDNIIQKIKLLFILEKMEIPLTEDNLVDICTSSNDWFTFFDLKDTLIKLLQVGMICENQVEGEEARYIITLEGRTCLSHFYFRIPKALRESMMSYANENRIHFKRSQEYVSEYSKNKDGSYTVTLKIKEPALTTTLLEIKLKSPTPQSAVEASKKWKDKAAIIYENIFENLLDN